MRTDLLVSESVLNPNASVSICLEPERWCLNLFEPDLSEVSFVLTFCKLQTARIKLN